MLKENVFVLYTDKWLRHEYFMLGQLGFVVLSVWYIRCRFLVITTESAFFLLGCCYEFCLDKSIVKLTQEWFRKIIFAVFCGISHVYGIAIK